MEEMKTKEIVQMLYKALRKNRPLFNANEYKWRLGTKALEDLREPEVFYQGAITEKTTLYGISVEVDFLNPCNVQLFEDITYKIEG